MSQIDIRERYEAKLAAFDKEIHRHYGEELPDLKENIQQFYEAELVTKYLMSLTFKPLPTTFELGSRQ